MAKKSFKNTIMRKKQPVKKERTEVDLTKKSIPYKNPVYMYERKRLLKGYRPISFSMDIVDDICERVAMGETLSSICENETYPTYRMFSQWVIDDPVVEQKYKSARLMQATFYADEIIDIVDHPFMQLQEFIQDFEERGKLCSADIMAFDAIAKYLVQLQKNRTENRKWVSSKLYPQIFGDRREPTLKEKSEDIKNIVDLSKLTDEELEIIERAHAIASRAGNNKSGTGTT